MPGAQTGSPRADRLRRDHQVLDIEGRRACAYRTTYFDTPARRCASIMSRIGSPVRGALGLEEDSRQRVFETKLKRSAEKTGTRQIDHPSGARGG